MRRQAHSARTTSSRRLLFALTASAFGAPMLNAQASNPEATTPLTLSSSVDTTRALAARTSIEFTLNRPLTARDGELVMTVGAVDVTAFAARAGERFTYQPTIMPLPAGNTDVVVYQKTGAQWTELKRVSLKVLTVSGFTRVAKVPTMTLGVKGQLAEGHSEGIPEPERPTFQDFVFNGSLQTTHERSRVVLETFSNYVGSSRRQEALRFAQEGATATRVDLSDYRVVLRAGAGQLTLGNTAFGASRHLINGFASRGASLAWNRAGTQFAIGALNAAPIVGWNHLVGLERPSNRVFGASVGRELIARRPGAFKVDITMLKAAMLPLGGFRQGAVLDAEASAGGTLQLAVASPKQRLRLIGGVSQSRFDNPALDPQLRRDTVIRAVERATRGAQFVEANVGVLQNQMMPRVGLVNVGLAYRHERIEPLYRSVTTSLQADRQNDGADATISVGALSGQVSSSWSRDNLGRLATILTTLGESIAGNFGVPLAQLVHAKRTAAAWPMVTLSLNRVHQRAEGEPAGGTFRAQDLPDQLSINRDLGVQWQLQRWRVALRQNRSHQDNRQLGRQAADFSGGSDVLAIGTSLGQHGDVTLDIGNDFQRSEERAEETDTRRAGFNANLRSGGGTGLVVALSLLQTSPPTGPVTLNSEQRLELSQPLTFLHDARGGSRGQLFLRFARSTARIPDFALAVSNPLARRTNEQWAFASGLNLRMF